MSKLSERLRNKGEHQAADALEASEILARYVRDQMDGIRQAEFVTIGFVSRADWALKLLEDDHAT